jgi:hypothetical protein
MASRRFFRQLRILALLFILLVVAVDAWLARLRTTDWNDPLWVVVYPINGDSRSTTSAYIGNLTDDTFLPVRDFIAREAGRYGLPGKGLVHIRLGPQVHEIPPVPPPGRNVFSVGLWSLQLRYWVMRTRWRYDGPPADIRIFVKFYDPESRSQLAHSLGLQKGLVGVVNAFANRAYDGRTNVVITHELLHTLGATDKYNLNSNQPAYPAGYAEPDRRPLYPQSLAEIMGGRIPESDTRSIMPVSLRDTVIGAFTAREIRWVD